VDFFGRARQFSPTRRDSTCYYVLHIPGGFGQEATRLPNSTHRIFAKSAAPVRDG
jgi:hypothetical protein